MFGIRLQKARTLRNLSQEDLAQMLGVVKQQISRWENGGYPSAEYIMALSKSLLVSTDFLLGVSDDITPQLNESELSDIERQLITAYRLGDIREAMKIIAFTEEKNQ